MYRGLYENEKAVRKYCGAPAVDEETGDSIWPDDCYARLHKIFWSRLQVHYKYADWDEVRLWCEGYPDKCDAPKKIERLVRYSNGKASYERLQNDLTQIEQQRHAAHQEIDRQQLEAFEKFREDIEFGDSDCIMTSRGVANTTGHGDYIVHGNNVSGRESSTTVSRGETRAKCRKTPR